MPRASRTVQRARRAVRTALEDHLATLAAERSDLERPGADPPFAPLVLVGVSGGADSLALLAASLVAVRGTGLEVRAVTIDHGLQEGSDRVAQRVVDRCEGLGIRVHRRRLDLDPTRPGGVEAVARAGRHEAFDRILDETDALALLLAHTADDQAEQVLMALARGSGTRTVAGIPRRRGRILRPFLGDGADDDLRLRRTDTEQVCRESGLEWWDDPMNSDPRFLRSRVRHVLLPELTGALGQQIVPNLARTADLARADADLLDGLAAELLAAAERPATEADEDRALLVLDVAVLGSAPGPLRTRALLRAARRAAAEHGRPSGKSATSVQVRALEALVTDWKGQGAAPLPGSIECVRRAGRLVLRPRSGDLND
jgi:tRNA(Ile)-lysidine synthase